MYQQAGSSEQFTFTHDNAVCLLLGLATPDTLTKSRTAIHTVTVAGHEADFTHHDPLSNITIGGPNEAPDCHRHPELKRKIYSALQEGDEGELAIAIPREVPLKQSGHLLSGPVSSESG